MRAPDSNRVLPLDGLSSNHTNASSMAQRLAQHRCTFSESRQNQSREVRWRGSPLLRIFPITTPGHHRYARVSTRTPALEPVAPNLAPISKRSPVPKSCPGFSIRNLPSKSFDYGLH
jgi:hypothetical protein